MDAMGAKRPIAVQPKSKWTAKLGNFQPMIWGFYDRC
jgi:hypothetical protein